MSQTIDRARLFSSAQPDAGWRENISARTLTTFGLGGTVRDLFEPKSLDALRTLLCELRRESHGYRVLGAGSNLIFSDRGIFEPVIRLGRAFTGFVLQRDRVDGFDSVDQLFGAIAEARSMEQPPQEGFVTCAVLAGAPLMSLSRELSQRGLSGLEFGAGIPASLGGAVVMNAGAHGNQLSDIVSKVFAVDSSGNDLILTKEQLNYSYRHSELPAGAVVLGAELRLRVEDPEIVRKRRTDCLAYRKQTQPLALPSAGSAFRNPSRADLPHDTIGSPQAAAQLLEQVGLKGVRSGGVAYSDLHANWLVRLDESARSEDARTLLELGIAKVEAEHSVRLRPEIVWWD